MGHYDNLCLYILSKDISMCSFSAYDLITRILVIWFHLLSFFQSGKLMSTRITWQQ